MSKQSIKHLKIIFGGKSHEIDADVLIESLVNYSIVTQEVSVYLSPDSKVNIKIKAIQRGSFELLLNVIADASNNLFSGENVTYAASVIGIVGGLYKFKKWLSQNGEPDVIEQKDNNTIKVKNNNGEIVINNNVFHIYQSSEKVREGLKNTFKKLKDAEEIDDFEIIDEDSSEKVFKVNRNDFELMASDLGEPTKRKQSEVKKDQELFVFKVVFRENYKWEFFYNGNRIYASIIDKEFIDKVNKGKVAFRSGDRIIADLKIVKVFNEAANVFVNDEYFVIKVKSHIPRISPTQQSLEFLNEDDHS